MSIPSNDNRLIKVRTGSGIDPTHPRAKHTVENIRRAEFQQQQHELLMERLRLERRLERLNDR